jgi:hypothetical protein
MSVASLVVGSQKQLTTDPLPSFANTRYDNRRAHLDASLPSVHSIQLIEGTVNLAFIIQHAAREQTGV